MSRKNMYRDWFKVKRNKGKRMFSFVEKTINPLGGDCYGCRYCYIHGINGMKRRFPHIREKYSGAFKLYDHILDKTYLDKTIFFCDCIDWLHNGNSSENIYKIIEWIERSPHSTFISLTRNNRRYLEFKNELPANMVLGVTIESNKDYPEYSNAPNQFERLKQLSNIANDIRLSYYPRLISIEPVLKFDLHEFVFNIQMCMPDCVVVGYDNHGCALKEPMRIETESLIKTLEDKGILVIRKTIRKAWYE